MVGPWGEGSKDMHSLVKTIAETKVATKARALGRDLSDKELGIVVTQLRKYLSNSFIQAFASSIGCASWGKELWQQLEGGTWPAGWRRVGDVIGKQPTWLTLEEGASLVRDRFL